MSELSPIFEGVKFSHLSYIIFEKKGVVSYLIISHLYSRDILPLFI